MMIFPHARAVGEFSCLAADVKPDQAELEEAVHAVCREALRAFIKNI